MKEADIKTGDIMKPLSKYSAFQQKKKKRSETVLMNVYLFVFFICCQYNLIVE